MYKRIIYANDFQFNFHWSLFIKQMWQSISCHLGSEMWLRWIIQIYCAGMHMQILYFLLFSLKNISCQRNAPVSHTVTDPKGTTETPPNQHLPNLEHLTLSYSLLLQSESVIHHLKGDTMNCEMLTKVWIPVRTMHTHAHVCGCVRRQTHTHTHTQEISAASPW